MIRVVVTRVVIWDKDFTRTCQFDDEMPNVAHVEYTAASTSFNPENAGTS